MDCKKDRNQTICNCSYDPCVNKGICCECLSKHIRNRQLPACLFPDAVERTFDRSFETFAELVKAGRV